MNLSSDRPVLTLVGPTASGKSEVAMALAERFGGEIINADALQVYRGFDIGTAKPTAEERRRVPHHLIDILDPRERYSAGEFARRGRQAIAEIRRRGREPIVVGGSGLYVRALIEGISPVPPGDEVVRRQLRDSLEEEGLEALRQRLKTVDPEAFERLPAADTQRILRALEVALVTGAPLHHWISERPFGEAPLPAAKIGLTLPRKVLYHRIEERVRRMVDSGWPEEVGGLLAHGVPREAPAFQAIGYRQLASFHGGEMSLEEALSDTLRATRQFAKRQMTWFRKEPGLVWIEAQALEQRVSDVISIPDLKDFGGSDAEA
jgi:tRNA dimethylallyltransferase